MSEIPSPQLFWFRNRYFPFPCPDTGSIILCSAISFNRSEALDVLISITFMTSDRPKIVWPGNASRSSTNMQCPVMKRIALIQEEIAKEQFKELCRCVNTIFQIIIVCPDEWIPKIPGVLGKNIICHIKAKRPQVLDEEHRRRSGVALSWCQVWDKRFFTFYTNFFSLHNLYNAFKSNRKWSIRYCLISKLE